MTAAVNHQHSFRLELSTGLLLCAVMNDRTIGSVSTDRWKTQLQKSLLLCPQFIYMLRSRHLIHRNGTNILLEPVHKPGYRYRILDMCPAGMLYLCLIFDGFHQCGRIFLIQQLRAGLRTFLLTKLL